MVNYNIDYNKVTHKIILFSFIITIMVLAKSILVPFFIAIFLSFLLYPVSNFIEKKLTRIWSIIIVFLLLFIVLSLISYFFGSQFYRLFQNIKDFGQIIQNSVNQLIKIVDNKLFEQNIVLKRLFEKGTSDFPASRKIIENTISLSSGFLATLALTFVYTFLFLLYRTSFKKFIMFHFPLSQKKELRNVLNSIQKVAQNYFFGLMIIILILGTLNGLGLMVMGFDYPFLFGYFAAFLAIIPYIGTFIGGLIPFIYALINYNSIWIAVAVVVWYMFVQFLEGNILTPKIVGSKVSINPLIAIMALLIGGLIWGIAGMILFIPMIAVLKVLFDHVESLRPYGLLLGSNFGNEDLPLLKRAKIDIEKNQEKED